MQADRPDFVESDSVKAFWQLAEDGELPRETLQHIFEQIKHVTRDVFLAVHSEKAVFQARRNAFELFGLDFVVDAQHRVFYLRQTRFRTSNRPAGGWDMIATLFRQTVAVAVDPFFGFGDGSLVSARPICIWCSTWRLASNRDIYAEIFLVLGW